MDVSLQCWTMLDTRQIFQDFQDIDIGNGTAFGVILQDSTFNILTSYHSGVYIVYGPPWPSRSGLSISNRKLRCDGSPSIAQTPEPTAPKRGDPAPSAARTAPAGEIDAEARWTTKLLLQSASILLVGLHSFCKLLPIHHVSKLEQSFTD